MSATTLRDGDRVLATIYKPFRTTERYGVVVKAYSGQGLCADVRFDGEQRTRLFSGSDLTVIEPTPTPEPR